MPWGCAGVRWNQLDPGSRRVRWLHGGAGNAVGPVTVLDGRVENSARAAGLHHAIPPVALHELAAVLKEETLLRTDISFTCSIPMVLFNILLLMCMKRLN